MKHLLISLPLALPLGNLLHAQVAAPPVDPCPGVALEQMSVMIIPFTKEGESIRTVIESRPDNRVAMNKVDEYFQGRGFQTVNFMTKLKEAEEAKLFAEENVGSYKQELLRFAQAEIVVEVDMTWHPSPQGNSATLSLTASLASTGTSMGSKVESSNLNISDNKMDHAQGAVEKMADQFLDQMQANFTKLKVEGRPLDINFTFSQGSELNMDSRIDQKDGKPLWAVLKAWLLEKAYNHRMGSPKKDITYCNFPMVRIPLVEPSTCMPYATEDFALEIQMFLESIGVRNTQDMKPGKIMVTIN